ncbi:hypothetical protein HWI79_853 [Cryptosporidium felis]|nr:hypothetical protein HWI79_853 [Cryptosporidium felis]
MVDKRESEVSEREKISNWLERQIQIWNGVSVNRLSGTEKYPESGKSWKPKKHLLDVSSNSSEKDQSKKQEMHCTHKIPVEQNTDSRKESPNQRFRFKDWSDLHNYLLESIKQENTNKNNFVDKRLDVDVKE